MKKAIFPDGGSKRGRTFFADAFISLQYTHQPFWHVILVMVTAQIRFLRINQKVRHEEYTLDLVIWKDDGILQVS
jgi:hypothetical protein